MSQLNNEVNTKNEETKKGVTLESILFLTGVVVQIIFSLFENLTFPFCDMIPCALFITSCIICCVSNKENKKAFRIYLGLSIFFIVATLILLIFEIINLIN